VRVSASLSLLVLAVALGLAPRSPVAANEPVTPDTIKVGIMDGMFKGVPEGLVKAGGQQFGGLFKAIVGLPGEVESEPNYLDLAKKIDANKTHLGVFHGFEWAWIKKDYPHLAPLAITIPQCLPQACVVVCAKDTCTGPHALKGANVDVPYNMKAHGYLYIDKLEKSVPTGSFKVVPSEDLSAEELLDDAGKGRAKAVLVDAGTLAAYQKNNPGKAAKVKLLCQSEQLPQTVLVYSKKHLPETVVKQLQAGLQSASRNPQGKAFLFMWNLKGFEPANAGYEELVAKCLATFPAPEKK
jgi:ABC-type phosphate/phosphonate transport system substrate-binding protein